MMPWLRSRLLAGFFIIVPLVVSVAALVWIFGIIVSFSAPLAERVLGVGADGWGRYAVAGLGVLVTLLVVLAVGSFAANVIGRRVLTKAEGWLMLIPVFRTIYAPVKQLVVAFSPDSEGGFKRVVMIEDPHRGWVMGFLTKEFTVDCGAAGLQYLVAVYVPTNHLYLGDIGAMSKVHEAHPDKNLYFTEQWTSGEGKFDDDLRWHVKSLIVGATRNWSRNVLEWNLAADPNFDPHTDDGGCTQCMGALTIGDAVTRNVSYYIIAHASKFVRPGAIRIASNITDGLHNVAFVNPDGQKVLVVVNDNDLRRDFVIKQGGRFADATLPAGAVATYVW